MKTSDLIRQLQACDPTGELHVDGVARVIRIPSYYDGPLQIINRDAEGVPVNSRIVRSGDKIVLETESIADALLDNPELPVEIEDSIGGYFTEQVAKWREAGRAFAAKEAKR